jgi:hypothetical protein
MKTGDRAYLVDIEVVLHPVFQEFESFCVFLGASICELLKWLSIWAKMLRLLTKYLFSSVETSF